MTHEDAGTAFIICPLSPEKHRIDQWSEVMLLQDKQTHTVTLLAVELTEEPKSKLSYCWLLISICATLSYYFMPKNTVENRYKV